MARQAFDHACELTCELRSTRADCAHFNMRMETHMTKYLLVIPAALALLTGSAMAQMSSPTTTTESTAAPVIPGVHHEEVTKSKTETNGFGEESTKTMRKDSIQTPLGGVTTTKKTSESSD